MMVGAGRFEPRPPVPQTGSEGGGSRLSLRNRCRFEPVLDLACESQLSGVASPRNQLPVGGLDTEYCCELFDHRDACAIGPPLKRAYVGSIDTSLGARSWRLVNCIG